MTSKKQIEANRKNSQASTGPVNISKTRFNAIKHGILAKGVVIRKGDGKENKKDFDFILNCLKEEYFPNSFTQEIIVEKLAVDYWRFARLIRCEKGLIELKLDYTELDLENQREINALFTTPSPTIDIKREIEIKKSINNLPDMDKLDILSRYETSLERRIMKKINFLMKLKKR